MTRANKNNLFANPGEEGRYIVWKIINDSKFRNTYFFEEEGEYTLTKLWKYINKCFYDSYGYRISHRDFGTIMMEHLLGKNGDWHPLKTYGGVRPFDSWMQEVAFHVVSAYLKEIGVVNRVKRQITVSTTKVTLFEHDPESCRFFIDEVMPYGASRDLLTVIYAERKPEVEIRAMYNMDVEEFEEARKKAEKKFRSLVLNNTFPFEHLVIADKNPRVLLESSDFTSKTENFLDNSYDNPFSDLFGVNLSNSEVEEATPEFVSAFVSKLKWTKTDQYVFLSRRNGVTPTAVGDMVGRSRKWVDNRYMVLTKRFNSAFKKWYETHS